MPDIRAVAVFQSHLEQGLWRSRHIQGLAADPKSREMFLAIIECTKGLQAARGAPDLTPQQRQKIGSRNTLCLCRSTCPAETQIWMDVEAAAKATRRMHCRRARTATPCARSWCAARACRPRYY